MRHSLTWAYRKVLVHLSDEVSGEDILLLTQEINSDPRFDDLRYQIWDFTAVTEITMTVQEVDLIAAIDRAAAHTNKNIKVASVITDELTQTLASLYQANMHNSPWEAKMFKAMDEAESWAS